MVSASGPFTRIYREIWADPKFSAMSEIGRLVYLYLLTTPFGNGLGCFRAGRAAMVEDSNIAAKRFAEGFGELLAVPLIEHDDAARVVFIPTYIERNPPSNPNTVKSLARVFATLPDCGLKSKAYQALRTHCQTKGEPFIKPFAELFREPLPEPLREPTGTYIPVPVPVPLPVNIPVPTTCITEPFAADGRSAREDGFKTFWGAYPRHTAKAKARDAWMAAKGLPELSVILSAIERQRASDQWARDGGAYIPHASTWIRGRRWEDEVIDPATVAPVESPMDRQARLYREGLRRQLEELHAQEEAANE